MNVLTSASLIAAAFLGGATSPALAQSAVGECALRIDSSTTNWVIPGYDPFATTAPVATFDVMFDNPGGAPCTFDPVFVVDQEAFGLTTRGRQVRIPYTLLDAFSNSNATPVSGRTIARVTRRPVVVQPQSQQLVRYQFAVNEDGLSADGLYSQRVTLVAEDRTRGATLASRALVLGVHVLPSAVLGLSGQYRRDGGRALVDLGELEPGVAKVPLQIRVSSTRAYRLEFTSRNAGQLRMSGANWSIPYSLGVGDKTLSLSGTASYDSSGTKPMVDALPLQFVIGDTAGKRAGTYSDVITVSIAAK
jgi:hypothetical protein